MKLDAGDATGAAPGEKNPLRTGYGQRLARARRADACRHRHALGHHLLRIVQAPTGAPTPANAQTR